MGSKNIEIKSGEEIIINFSCIQNDSSGPGDGTFAIRNFHNCFPGNLNGTVNAYHS